jgi:hypothetical protein
LSSSRAYGATPAVWLPRSLMEAASRLRTAMVTWAPIDASARAVSVPMPELAPVTTAPPVQIELRNDLGRCGFGSVLGFSHGHSGL